MDLFYLYTQWFAGTCQSRFIGMDFNQKRKQTYSTLEIVNQT